MNLKKPKECNNLAIHKVLYRKENTFLPKSNTVNQSVGNKKHELYTLVKHNNTELYNVATTTTKDKK